MPTKMLRWSPPVLVAVATLALVAACSGAAQVSTPPSAAPSATATPEVTPSPAASAPASIAATAVPSATPVATPGPSGPASLDAPASVGVGGVIEVVWTGPNAAKDYITVEAVGATRWTNEPYVYTTTPSPAKLPAPAKVGEYEIWYVNGATDVPVARRPITVTTFVGTLDPPGEVPEGSPFQVAWTGPNGPGDYITIIAAGAPKWTTESYFYTANGSPGSLVSPVKPGAYEIAYVTGQDPVPQLRRAITVTPVVITLEFPAKVKAGAKFSVTWAGPSLPQDYITIVPKGAPDGTYTSYAYTSAGNPATIQAPTKAGDYEIWYASDRVPGVFARSSIVVE